MTESSVCEILKEYIKIPSISETPAEVSAARWLHGLLGNLPYFQQRPHLFGLHPCQGDALKREVPWALVLGESPDTLILFHHLDVVNATDFGEDEPLAWESDALREAYLQRSWPEPVQKDLESGEWLFGRGSCDMKGGGAAQIHFVSELAQGPKPPVSVLLLAVPDEENLSVGMRSAVGLLEELRGRYGLNYGLAVNSEPNFGKDDSAITLFIGSVGKATALAVVQGVRCHTGNPYEGINAVSMLSAMVVASDGQMDAGSVVPPPAWMSIRDLKEAYDVSLPDSAYGTINLLYGDSPIKAMERLRLRFKKALKALLEDRRVNCSQFRQGQKAAAPWRDFDPPVLLWSEIEARVKEKGQGFREALEAERRRVARPDSGMSFQEATGALVTTGIALAGIAGPVVVLALVPPIYPAVSCDESLGCILEEVLRGTVTVAAGAPLETEPLFMGISDLSYLSLEDSTLQETLPENLPLCPEGYRLPLQTMAALNIPGINLGPRGKDLHQPTERVLIKDLEKTLPEAFRVLMAYLADKSKTLP